VDRKVVTQINGIPAEVAGFDPGHVIDGNRYLLDFLDSGLSTRWQVDFRFHRIDRIIVNSKNRVLNTSFSHYSILVKIWMEKPGRWIEVGEGNPADMKFNLNGLSSRIGEIFRNHKKSKKWIPEKKVPVVLNAGDGGILFHEILGHSLEADHICRKMSSVTPGDLGRRILSKNVTLHTRDLSDPFFRDRVCDDEGETSDASVLVEKGILRDFISDFFYQKLLGKGSRGHCRIQDFRQIPMPRMYALYLQPGPYHADELIRSVKYGILAKEPGSGKVFFNKNLFHFDIKAAYLIEEGRVTAPLGSVVVRGNITDALNSVAMIADDFSYDKGISYCHKNGQTVNVRVGQPSVKIDNLYVTRDYHD
jgi:predicted Zn-dependent protease